METIEISLRVTSSFYYCLFCC